MRMILDRIAVIPLSDPKVTEGGIIIPDSAEHQADQGIVKYRGPDVKDVRVGDHVFFSPYSGTKVSSVRDGILCIMQEDAVIGIRTQSTEFAITKQTVERLMEDVLARMRAAPDIPYDVRSAETAFKELKMLIHSHVYAEGFEW